MSVPIDDAPNKAATKHDVAWEKHFALLKPIYQSGAQDSLVRTTVINDLNIGAWAANQRYAHRNGKLSAERIAKLQEVGFVFEPFISQWEKHFAVLQRLHEGGTDINLPRDAIADGINIGRWLESQRYRGYVKGRLSVEQIARLESIGMKWTLKTDIESAPVVVVA